MRRKVVIYGGSGGIGSAVARMLFEREYDLHLVGRDADRLARTANEFGASYTVGDVEDPETFERVAEDAGEGLDGLVYAVGTINLRAVQRIPPEQYLTEFRVNAMGAALAVKASLPALKKASGTASVVLFSSVAAQQGFAFHASTGMAKAAVSGLTIALAAELAPKIRVNAVAPSLTQTPLAEPILANENTSASIAKLHALGRLGRPEDIASTVLFLLGPDADWITGQIIGVDGGRSSLR